MKSWLLIQDYEGQPVLAIINGDEDTIIEQLPNSVPMFDKEAYQYAMGAAMGEEECPWLGMGCKNCVHNSIEFGGCAINGHCDKGEEYWKEIAIKYCCGDKKLANIYPAKTEKEAKPLADYLAYKSCYRAIQDGFYKLLDMETITNLTINKD